MPREIYVPKRFSRGSVEIIDRANEIIDEYRRQGFILTVRQLFYQFVARGLIPNRQSEYKRISAIVKHGRLAGLIDWASIEDRNGSRKTRCSASSSRPASNSTCHILPAVAIPVRQNNGGPVSGSSAIWTTART
ncbi:MAG: hypothetical protein IIA64_10555 [Planctomycetes bacterium]|nr:hypothetical protein [Planctomycetota bacterium]